MDRSVCLSLIGSLYILSLASVGRLGGKEEGKLVARVGRYICGRCSQTPRKRRSPQPPPTAGHPEKVRLGPQTAHGAAETLEKISNIRRFTEAP